MLANSICPNSVPQKSTDYVSVNGDGSLYVRGDGGIISWPLQISKAVDSLGVKIWGVWRVTAGNDEDDDLYCVRLCLAGKETCRQFRTRSQAYEFHAEQLLSQLGWPRQPLLVNPPRHATWDHPEELEELKEYSFSSAQSRCNQRVNRLALTGAQLDQYNEHGFLLNLPVLTPQELETALRDFEELLSERVDGAPTEELRFKSAHTIARPLHQRLVARLATHTRVVGIVEAILGPRFVCWSAHLFCKLPGDPTEQPWHQDSGFWPLSQSRAITLWIAFDDVDADNAAVLFIEGSHRMGRLPWQPTDTARHLLTSQIPDTDLLGPVVVSKLCAGEASVHSDLTVHCSQANGSDRRRAGLALRFVSTDTKCVGPMINGYQMNGGCIFPKTHLTDPTGHWKRLRRRPGGKRAPRWPVRTEKADFSDDM